MLNKTLNVGASGFLKIGQATFPMGDSSTTPRSTASFGDTGSFVSRSKRQEVTTSSAVVGAGISIVGVSFDGPVSLTFADSGVNVVDFALY